MQRKREEETMEEETGRICLEMVTNYALEYNVMPILKKLPLLKKDSWNETLAERACKNLEYGGAESKSSFCQRFCQLYKKFYQYSKVSEDTKRLSYCQFAGPVSDFSIEGNDHDLRIYFSSGRSLVFMPGWNMTRESSHF